MKRNLFLMMMTFIIGVWSLMAQAQNSQQYSFVANDWYPEFAGDCTYDTEANTITSTLEGQNKVVLYYVGQENIDKYITPSQKYFVVKGTGLSMTNDDAKTSWFNNTLYWNTAPAAIWEEDGLQCIAWDISMYNTAEQTVISPNNGLSGNCICFTKDASATAAVITFIGYQTASELGILKEEVAYTFDVNDWKNEKTDENYTFDTETNTISSTMEGTNAIVLYYVGQENVDKYITPSQKYFVVKGTGLSMTNDDAKTSWFNNTLYWNTIPAAIWEESGTQCIAWDISANNTAEQTVISPNNGLSGNCICFTKDASATAAVITFIGYQTAAELGILKEEVAYTFDVNDWKNEKTDENYTFNTETNTISSIMEGTNAIVLYYVGQENVDKYITPLQKYFVVKGIGLSMTNDDAKTSWFNNTLYWNTNPVKTWEEDGLQCIAWDISANNTAEQTVISPNNGLSGNCICFTKDASATAAVITFIGYLTEEELNAKEDEEVEVGEVAYTFNVNDWVNEGNDSDYAFDSEANTISSTLGDTNAIVLYYVGQENVDKYITPSQKYFVVKGTGLSMTNDDAKCAWFNQNLYWNTNPVKTWEEDGLQCIAWDISANNTAEKTVISSDGGSLGNCICFTKDASAETAVITFIGYLTEEELNPEEEGLVAYTFDVNDWKNENTDENYTFDAEANTISSTMEGTNAVVLYYVGQENVDKYIIPSQKYFVVKGTGFSMTNDDAKTSWFNNNLYWNTNPVLIDEDENGAQIIAWDISSFNLAEKTVISPEKGLSGNCICFTKDASAESAIITFIGYQTAEELGIEEKKQLAAYTFDINDWVNEGNDFGYSFDTENNTISSTLDGTNAVVVYYVGQENVDKYITDSQQYFVVKGTGLSMNNTDAKFAWFNQHLFWETNPVSYWEEDGLQCVAWDISAFNKAEKTIISPANGSHGNCICFTKDESADVAVITYMGYQTAEELGIFKEEKTYTFDINDWINEGNDSEYAFDTEANTISSTLEGANAVVIYYVGQKSVEKYITPSQKYFVVKGTGLSMNNTDAKFAWFNQHLFWETNPVAYWEENGLQCVAWDISAFNTEDKTIVYPIDGSHGNCICFTKDPSAEAAVITYMGYLTAEEAGIKEVTMSISESAYYGTFIAPFDVEIPAGVDAYGCSSTSGSNLILTPILGTIPANTPVIVYSEDEVNKMFIGHANNDKDEYTEGYLTGVFAEKSAPVGSYVLQNHDGEVKFYLVDADNQPVINPNRCYLNVAGAEASSFGFDFAVGIDKVSLNVNNGVLYNLAGQAVDNSYKGIVIRNGKKVLVK